MNNYSTPGVYTEEIPVLPPSVAASSTAIPAFIGCTEKTFKDGSNLEFSAVKVSTLLEYQELFGGPQSASFKVNVTINNAIENIEVNAPEHNLYHSVDHYFKNGGGDCYIVSIGNYNTNADLNAFSKGLDALSVEDEPTLIVLGEAASLSNSDYYEVCKQALAQCGELKDRFCILDVQHEDKIEDFRTGVGTEYLKYGAAYTPYLQSTINYAYADQDVTVSGSNAIEMMELVVNDAIKVSHRKIAVTPKLKINKGTGSNIQFEVSASVLTISEVGEGVVAGDLVAAWNIFAGDKGGFEISLLDSTALVTSSTQKDLVASEDNTFTLADIRGTQLYARISNEVAKQRVVLPPSAAVAGVYAKTDRERGVWKAPANVSLNATLGPVTRISDKDQRSLNIDDNSGGKSINAIRSFVGKGTLIWGARTLDGNSNEWRYINVRRLFNMIEESVKKSTQFAVFEANDPVTWLKVKAMIQSFLYGIWQQGGLAGSTEDQAYFVNVGLGKTMTQQDILEGKMIFEIGLAASRPAEFIILKFSHKLQEV